MRTILLSLLLILNSGLAFAEGPVSVYTGAAGTVGVSAEDATKGHLTTKLIMGNGLSYDVVTTSTGYQWYRISSTFTYPAAGIVTSTGSGWGTPVVNNSPNWDQAFTERLQWDGGSTNLDADVAKTSLGLGTIVILGTGTLTDTSACNYSNVYGLVCDSSVYFYSGNVGIGTTIPPTKLYVDGDVYSTGYNTNSNFVTSSHYTGFPDRTATSLGWNDGTATLTLTATSDPIWINGVSYTINTLTKAFTNGLAETSGLYWFWITAPGGVPQLNYGSSQPGFDKCLVATVYWNTTTNLGLIADERHWMGRDQWMHEYLHETVGARYAKGLAGTFGNTTFSITAGEFYDEDIEHILSSDSPMAYPGTAMTTCKVLYHNGDADWKWDSAQTTPYKINAGNLQYNNGTTLTDAGANKYVNYFVFATNSPVEPIHVIIGTAQYNNAADATAATIPSFGALESAEIKLLYKITYKNDGTPTYQSAIDYRSSSSLPVSNFVATDHSSLSNLTYATSGHTGFQVESAGLTSLDGLVYVAPAFVRMTGADTFTLDTTVYQPAGAYLTTLGVTTPTSLTGIIRGDGSVLSADTTIYVSSLTTATPTNMTGLLRGNGSTITADTTVYLSAEADTLATVTGRGAYTNTNIGIGSTAPQGKLEVDGEIYLGDKTDPLVINFNEDGYLGKLKFSHETSCFGDESGVFAFTRGGDAPWFYDGYQPTLSVTSRGNTGTAVQFYSSAGTRTGMGEIFSFWGGVFDEGDAATSTTGAGFGMAGIFAYNAFWGSNTRTHPLISAIQGISETSGASNLTVSDLSGGVFTANDGAGTSNTFTRTKGVWIRDAGGAGTTNYGLYIDVIDNGTTDYAIFSNGGNSYHGGNIGIGSTNPGKALAIDGTIYLKNKVCDQVCLSGGVLGCRDTGVCVGY